MSRIHTTIPLQATGTASCSLGTSYDCPAHVLDKIKHLPLPIVCEVEMQDVQRYGQRVQQIVSVVPEARVTAPRAA